MKRMLLALVLSGSSLALCSPPPVPRLTIGPASKAPTIDGVVGEAEWRGAARLEHFVELDFSRQVPVQTHALALWDAAYLYLAVTCDEPNAKGIQANSTKRDSPVWRDDCVELFLDTNHDRKSYAHIIVNSKGAIYDRRSPGDANWNGEFVVATSVGADSWTVEIAIPFASLDATVQPGTVWGLNIGRERYAEAKSPLSAWSATLGKFLVPDRFGEVVFGERIDAPALRVPAVAFGANRLVASGCSAAPRVRLIRDWPDGLARSWPAPEPTVRPAGEDWAVVFRLVDGSEKALVVETAGSCQPLPLALTPEPKTALLARLVTGLASRATGDSPFARELQQVLGGAQAEIRSFTDDNAKRSDALPAEEWSDRARRQSSLAHALSGLSYVVWSKGPLMPFAREEMPPSLAPSSVAKILACGNETEATTMVVTNLGAVPLEGRLQVASLVLGDAADGAAGGVPNLLLNGALDLDQDGDAVPDHWHPDPGRKLACSMARDAFGETSFAFSGSGGEGKEMACFRQTVRLEAGKTYALSAELAAEGLAPGSACVRLINKGWTWSIALSPVSPDSGRRLYSRSFRAPEAESFQVLLRCEDPGRGTVRYHSVRLVEGQAAATSLAPDAIALHDVLFRELRGGRTVADALPLMNQARSLVVPPGESRQVWISLDTAALPAGRYATSVSFTPFGHALPAKSLPVSVRVLPVRLPERMPIAVFNWDYAKTEYEVADLANHRTNSFLVQTSVLADFHVDGTLKSPPDWERYDVELRRKLAYARANGGIVLFSYGLVRDFDRRLSKRLGWSFMDESWQKAFAYWAKEFERHLREDVGMAYDEYAVQLWDEATGEHAEQTARAGAFLRTIVPRMRTCMDGAQNVAEIRLLDPVIDLWIPHQSTLYSHQERVQIRALYRELTARGEPVWTYTCSTSMRALSPLDYYRLKEWRVWDLGVQGSCYWAYNSMRGDTWNDFDGEMADCGVMYPGQTTPITSRRWEATRDGREDYLCLHLLRQSAKGQPNEQEAEAFLKDVVARALAHTDDPAAFQLIRRELQLKLAEALGRNPLRVTKPPEAVRDATGLTVSWQTAAASRGVLFYRDPASVAWSQAAATGETATLHAVHVPTRPNAPAEWYLIAWDDNGASASVLSGLRPPHWFR